MKKLLKLRKALSDLQTRATAKIAEIVDGIADDAKRAIEAEHTKLLGEIEVAQRAVEACEAEMLAAEETAERTARETAIRTTTDVDTPVVLTQADVDATAQRAVAVERERVATINADAARFAMPANFAADHVARNTPLAEVRNLIWQEMVARSERQPVIIPHVSAGTYDEQTTRRRGMAVALACRIAIAAGERNVVVPEHARAFANMGIPEMAAECIGYRGLLRTPRQVSEVIERAFHTTSDFPAIFTDSLNNRLLPRYQAASPTYRLFAARTTTPDFRLSNVIRAGDFPNLQLVGQAGEIKYGTFGESKEQIQTLSYAVGLTITRQMLINDQLGAIDDVLSSYGLRIPDFENKLAFSVLTANSGVGPTLLTDSKAMFHADHGNLVSPGTAISVDSVGVARAKMQKQKSIGKSSDSSGEDGLFLNLAPRTLLCSPDKITLAEQLFAAYVPVTQGTALPASMRSISPVSDANLSTLPWYLFADPAIAPVLHYSFLEGFEGPRITSEDVFDVQGMKVKLEHDFGVSGTDFRGAVRNAGA